MVRAALLQFDICWENVAANITKVSSLLNGFGPGDLDVIVLPELWTCGFTMNTQAHRTQKAGAAYMTQLSRELDCAIIGGLPAKVASGQQNRCYLFQKGTVSHYSKVKTFKYAGEHLKYKAGSELCLWEVAGFRVAPFVCYDLRFPELARSQMPAAELLIYVANWPQTRIYHWRQLIIARAIENLCYVIGVNRTGKDGNELSYPGASMVVDPTGAIVRDCGAEEGAFLAELDPGLVANTRRQWPFLDDC